MTAGKEYNYTYEEGKLVRAAECGITLGENEVITAKTLTNTIRYAYDAEGTLTQKRIIFADGTEHTVYYETNDGNTVVKFRAGGRTVTSHSKSDSFGRKVFDELQLGTDFVSRQFTYHAGKVTDEHKDNAKVKSSATTQLVSQITFSDGRTLSYTYDAEERITKITDSIDGVTEYTYDAMGQLLTETVNGDTVNVMEYDKYGNVVSKNGVAYTYGDSVWKDRLTAYDGEAITYDAQGNPTTYLGHALTWEKGRQLKSFDSIRYTYNANGIRTGKTVNGVQHTYTLDGTKILRETWGNNVLIPLYDNEDSVCGVLYNNTPFYFQKNLQGDVIAISNSDGGTVARYSYDAWGKCTVLQDTSGRYIASVNPFRYRGYYYDSEIGMYYLQSRYYDPETGRFINADEPVFSTYLAECILEGNLYCYARNNSLSYSDYSGYAVVGATYATYAMVSQMSAMAAASATLLASIKAFVISIANIFVVVGLLLVVLAAVIVICKTIGNVYATIEANIKVKAEKYREYSRKICVYVLARKQHKVDSIFYVGRTQNITARYNRHKRTKGSFFMYVIYVCSSVTQSRVVEQCVLAGCLAGNFTSIVFGQKPSNLIRGVSSARAASTIDELGDELAETLSLLSCTSESDLLFLMNQ